MTILKIRPGDRLEMRKKHPCGSSEFDVLRAGSDVRIVCRGCGRDLVLPRDRLEHAVKKIIHPDEQEVPNE